MPDKEKLAIDDTKLDEEWAEIVAKAKELATKKAEDEKKKGKK